MLCDGTAYLRTEYPELFAAIGTIYGSGDGSTTFNIPNLATRVPVGKGAEYALGATGGEEKHTLTTTEIPAHNHQVSVGTAGSQYIYYKNGFGSNDNNGYGLAPSASAPSDAHTVYARNTGGSGSHNNMQPYTVVNYIIATGKNTGVSVQDIITGAQALPLGVEYGGTGANNITDIHKNLGIRASARNLLDNSDFTNPVNQRGQTSYSGSTYNIDRWRTFLNDNIVTVDNGCIRQTGTQLLQNLDANVIDKTKIYTLAACKVDGTIRIISGTFAEPFGNSYLSCYTVSSTGVPRCVLVESDGYKWAALYEGEYTAETLPEYQSKGYAAEISECRRYFLNGTIGVVHNLPQGGIRVDIPLAQPMRIDPTFTLPNKKIVYNNNATTFTVEYSWKSYRKDRILIAFTSSSTSGTTGGYSYIAEIDYQLSADL